MTKHIDKIVPISAIALSFVFALSAYNLANANPTNSLTNLNQNETKKPRILLVPGHDNEVHGAEFGDLKESELNLDLVNKINEKIQNDYEVVITRDGEGYTDSFENYFTEENKIKDFITHSKRITANLIESLSFEPNQKIKHNKADNDTIFKLYGINKWTNENGIDLAIHVHFNDYPRKNHRTAGKYKGFSIYIPEKQLPNHNESQKFAKIFTEDMKKHFSPSNLKIEEDTIIESQALIAIGANNTLKTPAALIEYSYIYEDFLQTENKREEVLDKMAEITKKAIDNYFNHF
jgi:N-acetylmuramoyl-L-alanine amidase